MTVMIWEDGPDSSTPLSAANLNRLAQRVEIPNAVQTTVNDLLADGTFTPMISEQVAATSGTFNVHAYGAVGDGIADDTDAVRDAIADAMANGGGVIYFPPGRFYLGGFITLDQPRGLVFQGAGSQVTTLTKESPSPFISGLFFQFLSGTRQGYGAGGSDIAIRGITFQGSFAQNRTGCVAQLHHVDGFVMEDCVVDRVVGGGHALDVMGSRNVTVRRCSFLGVLGTRVYTEAIQTDFSAARGFTMPDDNAGCDGLPTIEVTVDSCKFLPVVDGGVSYFAPNPMGTHTGIQSVQPRDYRFTNNYVEDWQGDNTSTYNGALHFSVGIDGLEISGNTFVATLPTTGYAINLYRGAFLNPLDTAQNPSPPSAPESSDPFPPRNVRIAGNTFLDRSTSGSGFSAMSVIGNAPDAYYAQNVTVVDNVMNGGLRFGYFQQARNLVVSGNVFVYGPTSANTGTASGTGVRLATCSDATIANNQLTGRDPMYVATSARVTVTGNVLTPVAVAGNTTYGIYYTGAGNSLGTILGNTVHNPSATAVTRGIYASNGAANAVIVGNTIVGVFTNAGVTTSGVTNVVVPAGSNVTA